MKKDVSVLRVHRAELDLIPEAIAQDYEAVKNTQTVVKVAFPTELVLLLVVLVWFAVRRWKASQVLS